MKNSDRSQYLYKYTINIHNQKFTPISAVVLWIHWIANKILKALIDKRLSIFNHIFTEGGMFAEFENSQKICGKMKNSLRGRCRNFTERMLLLWKFDEVGKMLLTVGGGRIEWEKVTQLKETKEKWKIWTKLVSILLLALALLY